ncbi:MAG: sodium/proton antiporter NhaB [Rhodospirillaceae bacterium]|nr:sodium/proton antiporter NhaB [Rhodospirillaceae bacterium]
MDHTTQTSAPRMQSVPQAFVSLFLGSAPDWYKLTILGFLVLNPIVLFTLGPFIAGWLLLAEFIFTLAMALKCYPLQPGGLLALEAIFLGMASPEIVYREVELNFPVLLLLMFMVAGIFFMRELLTFVFTKLFIKVNSKILLALLFCCAGALLSAFLDALTVIAVVITVATGLYGVYHAAASSFTDIDDPTTTDDNDQRRADLEQFRAFLRSIVMHAAVGTALGGVCTLVGEPQNLLIGKVMGWNFVDFFHHVSPVSMPVLATGLVTCWAVEQFKVFGFGASMPVSIRSIITAHDIEQGKTHDTAKTIRLFFQGIAAVFLVCGLGLHIAEVGLIGLSIIVFATAFTGIVEEKRIGPAFEEALPFTALLVVFFAIVAVIHEQHLFKPVIDLVLEQDGRHQLVFMYVANGLLSAISDNVFVATVYISATREAFEAAQIDRAQFDLLAVAINTGTNIPSVATPNGQAAFLFLLTSSLAPLIRLGYGQMFWMALPYTITMSTMGYIAVLYWL